MDEIQKHIGLFIAGIVTGTGVLAVELIIFVGDTIMAALKILPESSSASSILSTYSSTILFFTVGGAIINILIGYFTPMTFSFGYLVGDFLMIAVLATALLQIAPSVLIGMILAFVAVFIGLILKIVIGEKGSKYREYDYWG